MKDRNMIRSTRLITKLARKSISMKKRSRNLTMKYP